MKKINNYFSAIFSILILITISFPSFAQPTHIMNAAEIKLALDKLNVVGTVLYIAAHPDDENTAILAYYSNEKLLRTGYLAMTRGDGGQNLIGTEQGDLLGVIRTQELLQARNIDGAEQFFTRAIDFGYSKNADETFKIWDKEKILSDVVWVIRKFKPDVIITRFPGNGNGRHGHHTASAILAMEAFNLADDPEAFPQQLEFVETWKPKRIYWNSWYPRWGSSDMDTTGYLKVDLGKYNPLLGKSYTEIAAQSRTMHKSQGFGSSGVRSEYLNYFQFLEGTKAEKYLFEDIDLSWNRIPGGAEISDKIEKAINNFSEENPSEVIPELIEVYNAIQKIDDEYWKEVKLKEVKNLIQSCAGLWIESTADYYYYSPGSNIKITNEIVNRSNFPFKLKEIRTSFLNKPLPVNSLLEKSKLEKNEIKTSLPDNIEYSQPYWLINKSSLGTFNVDNQELIGKPVTKSLLQTSFVLSANGTEIKFTVPILYNWNDRVEGELYRPVEIVPEVAVNFEKEIYLFPDQNTSTVSVKLISNTENAEGKLILNLPESWKVNPQNVDFKIEGKNSEKIFNFKVIPPENSKTGKVTAEVKIGNKTISKGELKIEYSHFPIQTVFTNAEAKLIRFKTEKVVDKIGYIMGSGDVIPDYLGLLGYNVEFISDEELEENNLNRFDVIIAGIRVYNTREKLKINNYKLMDYVKNGGTYLVQYSTTGGLLTEEIGPYPFHLSHDRVTVEEAPVTFINKDHPVLKYPNKITKEDFENYIQERGLYFPDEWDEKYQSVLSMNDPGEDPKLSSILYTEFGKGVFIYTGISFFREIPAGVPGAIRLFINLLSAGANND